MRIATNGAVVRIGDGTTWETVGSIDLLPRSQAEGWPENEEPGEVLSLNLAPIEFTATVRPTRATRKRLRKADVVAKRIQRKYGVRIPGLGSVVFWAGRKQAEMDAAWRAAMGPHLFLVRLPRNTPTEARPLEEAMAAVLDEHAR